MGEVYRARDSRLNRDVAVKILLPALANDPDRLARFRQEARILASLNHQNIAHIHGVEEAGEHWALVMELVEGSTLADRIIRGALPLEEALVIARQIAEALEAAHEQGVIHGDLKPGNVKVRLDGTVKVLDFGLAKALDPGAAPGVAASSATFSQSPTTAPMSAAGLIVGTAAYMSPEQATGKSVDKRADLWAFGCVVYEMLTGRAPVSWRVAVLAFAILASINDDGTRLVYSAGDQSQLFVRAFDQLEAAPLAGIANARAPFLSPDGRWIGFFDELDEGVTTGPVVQHGALRKVSIDGGPSVLICRITGASRVASWGPDDSIVFATSDGRRASCACPRAVAIRPC
jgi:serine/threonine protein kinase